MEKMNQPESKTTHKVYNYPYSIAGQQQFILSIIRKNKRSHFEDIFINLENRIHAITTFLSLLELLNQAMLRLVQGDGINNFYLKENVQGDEEE